MSSSVPLTSLSPLSSSLPQSPPTKIKPFFSSRTTSTPTSSSTTRPRASVSGTVLSTFVARANTLFQSSRRFVKTHCNCNCTSTGIVASIGGITVATISLLGTFVVSAILLTGLWYLPTAEEEIPSYRVAFLGNSITFVNDLPRFMVALADAASASGGGTGSKEPHLVQNSCLHGSLSFRSFLQKGNGMYHKWQTSNALLLNMSSSSLFPYYEDGTSMIDSDDYYFQRSNTDNNDDDSVFVGDDDYYNARSSSSSSSSNSNSNERILIYDYGACSVNQLLFGYDDYLVEGNSNGKYKDDGMNPCFQDSNYLHYLQAKYYEQKLNETGTTLYTRKKKATRSLQVKWDYVVMNDQTVYPGIASKRQRSIRALTKSYSKLFLKTKTSRPVFLATYGYMKSSTVGSSSRSSSGNSYRNKKNGTTSSNSSSNRNKRKYSSSYSATSTDDDATDDSYYNNTDPTYDYLGDMVHFTSRIWYGYHQYAIELGKLLPDHQQPIIVPVGPAFLLLYEENVSMWDKMFYDDGYHPSPHGSFLIGCILYATLYGRMPSSNIFTIPTSADSTTTGGTDSNNNNNNDNEDLYDDSTTATLAHLWTHARRMQMSDMGSDRPFPTVDEAMYLMNVAERVALLGVLPNSLLSYEQVEAMELEEEE